MAAPTTVDEFLTLLRKSAVVDEKRLSTQIAQLRAVQPALASAGEAAAYMVREGVLTNFQAEQLMLGKWRRFTIGKYKVLERLGSGGMGSVYLCEHKVMRRRVAVKVLPSAKANDPAALARFQREARAVAALDHPNIVHAYDIDQDEALHFLVMEYVDGASLQEIVKRSGPLDSIRAAHYIRQGAEGLRHAHENGLVHRDIKPGNLMVDRTGVVKLLDMGLARFFNDEEDILTKKYDENVLGTADYLAPEQATDSHNVDIRADIYSLGATFYFVLTGRTPFGEGTIAQKLLWHQTRKPRPIRSLRPDVPDGIAAVLERMMEKDAQRRYQTPADLRAALEPWTRTPIAPPTEAEMPQLSPAVSGTASVGEINLGTSPGPATPPSSVTKRNWQIVGGPTASTTAVPNTPAAEASKPPPSNPKPRSKAEFVLGQEQHGGKWMPFRTPVGVDDPAVPEAARREDDSIPFEYSGPRTDDASSQGDTPTEPPPRRPKTVLPPPVVPIRTVGDTRKGPRWVLTVLLALLFAAAMGFGMLYFFPNGASWGPSNGRSILRVSTNPANRGAFPSIRRALRDAKAGERIVIVLMDPIYEEAVVIDGAMGPTSVTIEAAEGVKVRWLPPAGHNPAEPILRLNAGAGFHLKGPRILLDGQNRVQTLLTISGTSPGLTVEGLELRGFSKNAISLVSCVGDARSPARIQDIQTTTAPGETPEAAVVFEVDESTRPRQRNDFVVIQHCRTENLPFGTVPISRNSNVSGDNVRVLP
jgi:serine/threonine protein kinase